MGDLTDRVGRNLKGIINARFIGVSFHQSRNFQANPYVN